AWLASSMISDPRCRLIFVGENHDGEYGKRLLATIYQSGLGDRIRITGWADDDMYRQYLQTADVAVQLRTLSRGETSGTVLDCMNHGLPTIVNANGSMAELSHEAVWMLPNEFTDPQLISALETIWKESDRR
ncbi:glycosyltransferase family 4 protein, partial [Acidithiobacillus ferrooxidans]|nr:glycosyltransferase family 4 protein [Acidithiobacillus ferrooxidans]